jgi:hypothetical protein
MCNAKRHIQEGSPSFSGGSISDLIMETGNRPQHSSCLHSAAMPEFRRLFAGFPTRRLRFESESCGICGGQSSVGAGVLRVLRCPLPIIPSITPHLSPSIIGGWHKGQIVADVPSGFSLSSPREIKKLKIFLSPCKQMPVLTEPSQFIIPTFISPIVAA